MAIIGGIIGTVWAILGASAAFLSGNAWAWRLTIWLGPFAFLIFRPDAFQNTETLRGMNLDDDDLDDEDWDDDDLDDLDDEDWDDDLDDDLDDESVKK